MSDAIGDRNFRNENKQEDWQAREPTWKGRLAHLYHSDVMNDITFIVNNERINAHKLVLASASSVFHAMFYGPVAETNTEIEIVDYPNAEDFKEFLHFVYTEDLSLTWDNFFPVAYLAKKYYIPSLTKECCKFLSGSLKVENVLEVLSQCVLVDHKEMVCQCLEVIRVKIRELIRTEEFLKLDLQSLKSILAYDILDIEEVDLFLGVDKWCIHKLEQQGKKVTPTGKRKLIGNVVNMIRFPTLSVKDLTNSCLPSGLITQGQFVDLVSFLMSEEAGKDEKIKIGKMPFARSNRMKTNSSFLLNSQATANCFSYGTRFRIGRKLWLKGVKVINAGEKDGEKEGDSTRICIIKRKDGVFVRPKFSIKVADGENGKKMSYLIFREAVEFLPGVEYSIWCVNEVDVPRKDNKEKILGRLVTPKSSSWQQIQECFAQNGILSIKQSGRESWNKAWRNFLELIFSTFDNQPIPTEELLLLNKRIKVAGS
eukprot:Seg937.2 transcript_id=Seg937.2/GoldUCD/mRNA.D3Y31 product="BTB/POZ domain-containing protein 2" protein_id=Seg937.2/GoldUCD/D3Y31